MTGDDGLALDDEIENGEPLGIYGGGAGAAAAEALGEFILNVEGQIEGLERCLRRAKQALNEIQSGQLSY